MTSSSSTNASSGASSIDTPYALARAAVQADWIDYNGHMNVGYYHVAFDLASEPFFQWLGFDQRYRQASGASTFALESHLNFLREVKKAKKSDLKPGCLALITSECISIRRVSCNGRLSGCQL